MGIWVSTRMAVFPSSMQAEVTRSTPFVSPSPTVWMPFKSPLTRFVLVNGAAQCTATRASAALAADELLIRRLGGQETLASRMVRSGTQMLPHNPVDNPIGHPCHFHGGAGQHVSGERANGEPVRHCKLHCILAAQHRGPGCANVARRGGPARAANRVLCTLQSAVQSRPLCL